MFIKCLTLTFLVFVTEENVNEQYLSTISNEVDDAREVEEIEVIDVVTLEDDEH